MAVPMGPGNTEKQIQMMIDLKSTVLCATSSYALLLSEEINRRGLRDQIHLTKGVIGSERWSDKMRQTIHDGLGIELFDIYEGAQLGDDKKSMAFSLVFTPKDKEFENGFVDTLVNDILSKLGEKYNVTLRA